MLYTKAIHIREYGSTLYVYRDGTEKNGHPYKFQLQVMS